MTPSATFSAKYSASANIVAVHCPGATGSGSTSVSCGSFPVVWSYPQSSQNRADPARCVPQLGHSSPGEPVEPVEAGEPGETVESGETEAGEEGATEPPIFAPHVSQ
ncbi:hypothetical protein Apa02nite_088410 [Actinoplanes palleronii]|uniref:Uncharacterized protein n=1 Tax=Actinoplanes palleronii TaxID=113570 RepID=A0ABQ4BPY9_9ACTN|nr:hypothetical protein Apa02nite_088410 [Actinoplanes palleronii]